MKTGKQRGKENGTCEGQMKTTEDSEGTQRLRRHLEPWVILYSLHGC